MSWFINGQNLSKIDPQIKFLGKVRPKIPAIRANRIQVAGISGLVDITNYTTSKKIYENVFINLPFVIISYSPHQKEYHMLLSKLKEIIYSSGGEQLLRYELLPNCQWRGRVYEEPEIEHFFDDNWHTKITFKFEYNPVLYFRYENQTPLKWKDVQTLQDSIQSSFIHLQKNEPTTILLPPGTFHLKLTFDRPRNVQISLNNVVRWSQKKEFNFYGYDLKRKNVIVLLNIIDHSLPPEDPERQQIDFNMMWEVERVEACF